MYGYFALIAGMAPGEGLGYAALGFLAVSAVAAIRLWNRPAPPHSFCLGHFSGSCETGSAWSQTEAMQPLSLPSRLRVTPAGLRAAVGGPLPTEDGAVTFPKSDLRPLQQRLDIQEETLLDEQVSIVHNGVLTINFVKLTTPRGSGGKGAAASLSGSSGGQWPQRSAKHRAAAGGMILLQHTAVMSTQFDDLRHLVSTSEIGDGVEPAAESEPLRQTERLERIEDACLSSGNYAQAAAALSARITLLRNQYGSQYPELAAHYLRLANLYVALERPEEAEQCQLRALDIRSKEAQAREAQIRGVQDGQAAEGEPWACGSAYDNNGLDEDISDAPLTAGEAALFAESMLGLSAGLTDAMDDTNFENHLDGAGESGSSLGASA